MRGKFFLFTRVRLINEDFVNEVSDSELQEAVINQKGFQNKGSLFSFQYNT